MLKNPKNSQKPKKSATSESQKTPKKRQKLKKSYAERCGFFHKNDDFLENSAYRPTRNF